MIPDFVTHYYLDQPFRTLTELSTEECDPVLKQISLRRELPRRLKSEFYFRERRR